MELISRYAYSASNSGIQQTLMMIYRSSNQYQAEKSRISQPDKSICKKLLQVNYIFRNHLLQAYYLYKLTYH